MFNAEKVENAVRSLLEAFGEDMDREGLKDTPRRVAGYWRELLEGSQYTNEQIAKMFGKCFTVPTNPLVVKQVKDVYSHCEHHLALMYNMTVTVAYRGYVRQTVTVAGKTCGRYCGVHYPCNR